MLRTLASTTAARHHALLGDSLGYVIGIQEGANLSQSKALSALNEAARGNLIKHLELSGMRGKKGQTGLFFGVDATMPRLAIVGLGKPTEDQREAEEAVRQAAAVGARKIRETGATHVIFGGMAHEQAVGEGAALGLYEFDAFKKAPTEPKPAVAGIGLLSEEEGTATSARLERGLAIGYFQNVARNLANMPSNHMTPTIFAQEAAKALALPNVTLTVRDKAWILEQGMGAFYSVTKGTAEEPVFLEIKYAGAATSEAPYVLVGKGVTFDSGGISIKPSAGMGMMKGDMQGAAVTVASVAAAAHLKLNVNVNAYVPLCENMPSGTASKPGDIVKARNGLWIEIDNTDAEGRLILCDALDYARTDNAGNRPKAILDMATLTGAMDVALGYGATGVFSNNDTLWDKLNAAGLNSGELLWRMPLLDEYREAVKASTGDIINSTATRSAGSCTAACFLENFIEKDQPWAHLDIAGVMHIRSTTTHHIAGMTGRPLRAVVDFLAQQQ